MFLKNLLICLVFLSGLQCKAQASFDIIADRVNVGVISFDSLRVTGIVYYTNNGTAPLYLTSATTFCPCTKVEFSQDGLAPGDTACIYITHRMKEPGMFNEAARISYFDPNDESAAKYIFLSGEAEKKEDEDQMIEQ